MSDYLGNLAARSLNHAEVVQPRQPQPFEQPGISTSTPVGPRLQETTGETPAPPIDTHAAPHDPSDSYTDAGLTPSSSNFTAPASPGAQSVHASAPVHPADVADINTPRDVSTGETGPTPAAGTMLIPPPPEFAGTLLTHHDTEAEYLSSAADTSTPRDVSTGETTPTAGTMLIPPPPELAGTLLTHHDTEVKHPSSSTTTPDEPGGRGETTHRIAGQEIRPSNAASGASIEHTTGSHARLEEPASYAGDERQTPTPAPPLRHSHTESTRLDVVRPPPETMSAPMAGESQTADTESDARIERQRAANTTRLSAPDTTEETSRNAARLAVPSPTDAGASPIIAPDTRYLSGDGAWDQSSGGARMQAGPPQSSLSSSSGNASAAGDSWRSRADDVQGRAVVPSPSVVQSSRISHVGAAARSRAGATPEPEPAPTIRVQIGRIEVRAVVPPPAPQRQREEPPKPRLSLNEYLRAQRGGHG